jgi:uncharacterized protein with ParB-like and HNH nuclease domain
MTRVVTNLLSINDIFKERLFKIPDYQRGYSWEQEQLMDLIKDIDHIATIEHRHYTGTVVISYNSTIGRFEVVDGQQRMTTLIILLKLIFECDPVKYASIKETFLTRDGEYVFETNEETSKYFREVILGTNKAIPDEIKSMANLKNAKQLLGDWLRENRTRIDQIHHTVIEKLGFICFAPEKTAEIGIMFEVINNRGKALSELEKIKNYFIYYATIHSQNILRTKINDNWGDILRNLSHAKVTSNNDENYFLRNCYIVFYSANKSKSWYVYDELKDRYKPDDTNDVAIKVAEIVSFIEFLQQAARHYAYLHNGAYFTSNYNEEYKKELACELKRLRCHPVNASIMPLYLAAMSYWSERKEDVIKLLKLIEVVNFRIYVIPNTKIARADSKQGDLFYWAWRLFRYRDWKSAEDENAYTTLKSRKAEGDIFDYAFMMLEDFTLYLCPEETFIQSLTIDNDEAIDYYQWNGLRFFLASYEEMLNANRKETWDIEKIKITREESISKGNDYLSREHIWAQKNRAEDFPSDIKEKRRLGNFVLLGLSSNIQLQDDDIDRKVNLLIEKSSISMLQIKQLQEYCNKATVFASSRRDRKTKYYFHEIAIHLIDQRENDLIKFALDRWKLPTEEFTRFDRIDSFEAHKQQRNENYFVYKNNS